MPKPVITNKPVEPKRDRHGFRGVPPPVTFDFDALADGALLSETDVAAILRMSTNTVASWRQRPDHPLRFLVLPNGFVRYTAACLHCMNDPQPEGHMASNMGLLRPSQGRQRASRSPQELPPPPPRSTRPPPRRGAAAPRGDRGPRRQRHWRDHHHDGRRRLRSLAALQPGEIRRWTALRTGASATDAEALGICPRRLLATAKKGKARRPDLALPTASQSVARLCGRNSGEEGGGMRATRKPHQPNDKRRASHGTTTAVDE